MLSEMLSVGIIQPRQKGPVIMSVSSILIKRISAFGDLIIRLSRAEGDPGFLRLVGVPIRKVYQF